VEAGDAGEVEAEEEEEPVGGGGEGAADGGGGGGFGGGGGGSELVVGKGHAEEELPGHPVVFDEAVGYHDEDQSEAGGEGADAGDEEEGDEDDDGAVVFEGNGPGDSAAVFVDEKVPAVGVAERHDHMDHCCDPIGHLEDKCRLRFVRRGFGNFVGNATEEHEKSREEEYW
jgi:hypothetical protein